MNLYNTRYFQIVQKCKTGMKILTLPATTNKYIAEYGVLEFEKRFF